MFLTSVSSRVILERCKSLWGFRRRAVDMQHELKLPEEGASIFRNQIVLADGIGF